MINPYFNIMVKTISKSLFRWLLQCVCVCARTPGYCSVKRCWGWGGGSSDPEEEQLISLLTQELPSGLPTGGKKKKKKKKAFPSTSFLIKPFPDTPHDTIPFLMGITAFLDFRRKWQNPVGTNMAAGPTPGPHGAFLPTQPCLGSCCWIRITAMYHLVKRLVIIKNKSHRF